jgi:heat shock protein HslJ
MTSVRAGRAAILLVTSVLVTACGGGSSSTTATGGGAPTPDDLDGTTYVSSSVEGHDLAEGTHLRLEFADGRMSANAGCNTMSGELAVRAGRLSWTGAPATTMMGCPQELMDQDQWLSRLLVDGVDATLDGRTLTLSDGDVTIRLEPKAPADASSLFGRTWTVTDLTTPHSAAAIPEGVRTPTLQVAEDGSVVLDTGCNRGHTQATADGDVLTFAPVALTKMACPGPATQVEHSVLQALEGRVTVSIHGDTATLDNGHHGMVVSLG